MISSLTITVVAVLLSAAWAVRKLAQMAVPLDTQKTTER
jgi:hypothetical protein